MDKVKATIVLTDAIAGMNVDNAYKMLLKEALEAVSGTKIDTTQLH